MNRVEGLKDILSILQKDRDARIDWRDDTEFKKMRDLKRDPNAIILHYDVLIKRYENQIAKFDELIDFCKYLIEEETEEDLDEEADLCGRF